MQRRVQLVTVHGLNVYDRLIVFVNSSRWISIFLKRELCEQSLESEKAEKAESF